MINPEQKMALVTQKFDSAISTVRDSGIPAISEIAHHAVDKISKGDIAVMAKHPLYDIPSITGFSLFELPVARGTVYKPLVVIDPDKILSSDSKVIQADLVRTLGIAHQFPVNGYERRLSDVYDDALELQKKWLERHDVFLEFDPRTMQQEELKRKLMGNDHYYMDTGFADWQQVIAKQLTMPGPFMQKLRELEQDKNFFLILRQKLSPIHYQVLLKQMSPEEYLQRENRVETNATLLVGNALLPNPGNN